MNIIRKVGRSVKAFFYRSIYHLKNVDSTTYFGGKSSISSDLIAGKYVYIGPNCSICPQVSIGDYTMLANNVSILGGDHEYNKIGIPIIFSGRSDLKRTEIGVDCWIGAHSIILRGVKIGHGSIIAAGAVVTKDVEPYSIYAGIPAKKIKTRFKSEKDNIRHMELLKTNFQHINSTLFCKKLK